MKLGHQHNYHFIRDGWLLRVNACSAECLNSVLNVKAVVAAFNQEKALVGAFSVITNLRIDLRFKLYCKDVTLSLSV